MSVIYLIGSGGFWQSRKKTWVKPTQICSATRFPALAVRGPVPEFLDQKLKEVFIVRRTHIRRYAQPRAHHVCDPLPILLTDGWRNIQPAGKEDFNQFGFLKREFGGLRNGELGIGRGIEEQSRFAIRGFMHHQRARHVVTHATMLIIQQHGYDANSVEPRQVINNPDQVAGGSFKGSDGTPRILDDANAGPSLSRGLTFPERFENRVITPGDDKAGKDHQGHNPSLTQPAKRCRGNEGCSRENSNIEEQLKNAVQQGGHEPAAYTGERKFKVYLFGCVNGKLVQL